MKIQCDVCDKDEASVFCVADEAALCSACDHRVHHANKLAGKHQRFSLLHPSTKQAPLCDICQERRAFLFCQEDRAILCRECDIPIHKANEHTQKHNRFLLTGVKLSPTSSLYSEAAASATAASSASSSANSVNNNINVVSDVSGVPILKPTKSTNYTNKPRNVSSISKAGAAASGIPSVTNDSVHCQMTTVNGGGDCTSSSISEYLIEMLPGWHVEDFLDPSTSPPFGFCKSGGATDNDMIPLWDGGNDDLEESNLRSWVPLAAAPPPYNNNNTTTTTTEIQSFTNPDMVFGGQIISFKGSNKDVSNNIRKWTDDNSFAVPQIINPPQPPPPQTPTAGSKRYRTLL